jgi:hypothetical protein
MVSDAERYVRAIDILPTGAETRIFDIMHNAIVLHGCTDDFKTRAVPPSKNDHYLKVWTNWFKSSKRNDIRLTFVLRHIQNYTDLNGRTQSGEICNVVFRLFFKMLPEAVSTTADEAEQEIKVYFSRMELPLQT